MENLKVPLVKRFSRLPEEAIRFREKVVVITGASSGIGRACALEFAEQGAHVVVAARREKELLDLADQIRQAGVEALPVVTDVRRAEDCERLIHQTLEKFGKINVLINNAGISMRATFENTDLEVIKELMDTNFYGAVYCTKFALPHLLEQKGTVIGISSITGLAPLPGRTGYVASKHAMDGFFNTLRLENLEKGLNVMVVHPGFTSSEIRKRALNENNMPQEESPRNEEKMMSSERVAWYVARAAFRRERDLVLTPQGKIAVWLHKNFPGITDRILLYEMSKENQEPAQPGAFG
jgi:dehydrogenase/reductase SDR family protein 7B